MKTQVMKKAMKKKMKTRLAFAVLMLALGSSAYAQTVNPFQEGVKLTALTTAQVESLQEYLDASKTALTKALDQAKGKSFGEANQIYLDVIKAVVIESYKNTPRSGLILRFALNQALELTFGVPSLDGKTNVSSGVLQSTSNQDLLTVMLEDSIQLALKYYQDDHDAVKKGTLLDLPYMAYAADHLILARTWLESVPEYKLAYAMSITAVKNYLISAAKDDELHQKLFADEIIEANNILMNHPATAPTDAKVLMGKVRVLRGKIRKLLESTQKKVAQMKITQAATGVAVPAGSTNTNTTIGSTVPNVIGMEFVGLPGGTFTMGSPGSEKGRDSDETQHSVTVSGFQMQVTDVTQMQYFKVVGSNPSYFKSKSHCESTFTTEGGGMCPSNPVENVSWNDTQNFVNKMNAQNDGYTYRLPTEAEWEYAARAGTTTAYSFGDSEGSLPEYAWYWGHAVSTMPVKMKKPNAFGLYDMHGNVWQWVQDWYDGYNVTDVVNPKGPSSGSYRVLRGGGYGSNAERARSALRCDLSPGDANYNIGFRLVRTPR